MLVLYTSFRLPQNTFRSVTDANLSTADLSCTFSRFLEVKKLTWRGTLKTEGTESKPAGFAWLPQGALCCWSCCVGALQIHLCYLQSETLFVAGLSTHIYKYKMAQEKVLTSTNHLCSYLYSSLLPLTSAISCTYLFNFKEEHLLKEKNWTNVPRKGKAQALCGSCP